MEPVENKLKSPKAVWYIVCNELCERFNYFGLRTILVLYLTSVLQYSDDYSTMMYHSFIFLSYFMPFFGAILADSYWGKFKTMIRLSIVYALGNIILTGASMASNFTLDYQRCLAIVGLVLISIGTGGIKPCACSFGGDQFELPEQQVQLARFFKTFVTAIFIGAVISTFSMPELRENVRCLGRDTCYPLAFGVLSLLMITAIVIFCLGKKLYIIRKPENHVIFKTFGCIFYGIRKKFTPSNISTPHWLDHANHKYSEIEVSDTKSALEVLYLYTAFPVFWALYEQQGSRWTLQATLMNGKMESIDWEIKPDQIQTVHPLFALLLILSFNSVLFPFLTKFGIRRPLQKLVFSFSMAVLAFLFAGILHFQIFGKSTVIPHTESQFVIYNGFDCGVHVSSPLPDIVAIGPLGSADIRYTQTLDKDLVNITLKFDSTCSSFDGKLDTILTLSREKSISYFLTPTPNKGVALRRINLLRYDDLTKPKNGHPNLRIVIGDDVKENGSFALVKATMKKSFVPAYNLGSFVTNGDFRDVAVGSYNLTIGGKVISSNIDLMPATIYTLIVRDNGSNLESKLYATDEGNYVHILWQAPQYTFMILADVIFIITTIEFSFTEAPLRIKSFMSSCYLMTQAIGNLIIVFISALSFQKQAHEYLFFSGLMLADTLLLAYLSSSYKYKNFKQSLDDDGEDRKVCNEFKST